MPHLELHYLVLESTIISDRKIENYSRGDGPVSVCIKENCSSKLLSNSSSNTVRSIIWKYLWQIGPLYKRFINQLIHHFRKESASIISTILTIMKTVMLNFWCTLLCHWYFYINLGRKIRQSKTKSNSWNPKVSQILLRFL